MRIVITGGAGFIGKKLARALLARGTLMDRQRHRAGDPRDHAVRRGRGRRACPTIRASRRSPATSPIAAAVHGADRPPAPMACSISPRSSAPMPRRTSTSATGSTSTAPATCSRPAARCRSRSQLVFASSVAVYGGDMPEVAGRRHDPHPADLLRRARRRRASCCSTTTAARASSTAARCACRRSWCARAGRTGRPRPSRARSSASRSPARRRSARSSATPRCTSSRRAA